MLDAKQVQAVFDIIRPQQDWNGGDEGFCRAVAEKVVRALQAVGPEPAVAVKPLEWHKSRMPSWNDDWHTTAPIIYTVRCADENGWKWSFHGGQGYERSPEAAKAAAEADYASRIRSALVATPPAEPVVGAAQPAETYYTKGKDAEYFEKLSDKDFAWALTCASQDLNDSDENVSQWMPVTALLSDAADRISALATKPAVKDDETVVALPPTREYVDRIVRIFRDRPADDTSAVVLQDYALAALAAKDGRS